jgi:hypothetical protein
MPTQHAKLSPSSAHRWLHCTAAPGFESQFESRTSVYAEEGTLAHEICELYGRKQFQGMTDAEFTDRIENCKRHKLYSPEMLQTAQTYVDFLTEKANTFANPPFVDFEVRVSMEEYVPECFGTCDCIMIGDGVLRITDYKHGKGVAVSAVRNPQMLLYALGALRLYQTVFGDTIRRVDFGIMQPRISEYASEDTISTEELIEWGTNEAAKAAVEALGPESGRKFCPGDWCKFCRGKVACRAFGTYCCAAEDFKEFVLPNKAEPPLEPETRAVCGLPPVMTDEEIAEMLRRYDALKDWYESAQEYALQAILSGKTIPGFRVVEGRSARVWSDQDAAIKAILQAGYPEATVYKPREPESLSSLEKLLGKKKFAEVCGDLVTKPQGKPTLVEAQDKRPDYAPASVDFAGVIPE